MPSTPALDTDAATHCTRCKESLAAVTRDASRYGFYRDGVCVEVVCPACVVVEKVEGWRLKRELRMPLVLDAQSAVFQHDEAKDLSRLQPVYARLYARYIDRYREVMADFGAVDEAARLTEIAVWFGRPDAATPETVERSREFARSWWPGGDEANRDFGLPPGERAVQTYYRNADARGHSYRHDTFTALLWGSAGRVLLTVRDNRSEGDPQAAFGGATVTLIFDETAAHPRGGVQSLAGTRAECLALLKALRDGSPTFVPDDEITVV